ncbi:UDP-N-acetylmuramyl-tripeptide synthetase [Candidatus Saccharibacteria bacterium]|nr:UDP-N-acetylmuramyl-tripeptide synthetase [Candidatus Saccharibacteria bacterium]
MNLRRIVKRLLPRTVFKHVEPFGHLLEAVVFNVIYGFPARGLRVIGVTGTNGKTTTCFLIHRMLNDAGYKTGLMTTVAYGVGEDIHPQVAHMTTVSVPVLLKRIKQMKKEGVDWLVLETTSHALAQHRVWGVPYSIAVLTNITHEHLDYHGSFKRYQEAKRKMFKMANHNWGGLRLGVINADDESVNLFAKAIKNTILYGVEHGELRAKNVKTSPSGVSYTAVMNGDEYQIKCHLPGSFNVYNSLAAVAVGRCLGFSREQIERGIASLKSVEGRMARLDEGQPFEVIVDFAHTPDSFEKLFKDLRPNVAGKMIVLFGSAGRRDEAKRAVQGELAGRYADEVIITEEDDRDVDGLQIMEQIAEGAERAGKRRDKNLFLVHDRQQAINFAVSRAKNRGDVVLLLGKGHEKSIERADGEHPWNEVHVAQAALKALKP